MHHPSALIFGLLMTAYWCGVAIMVVRIRRLTGRSANFLPRESTGRLTRLLWAPLVGAWVVVPYAVALMADPPPILVPLVDSPALAWPAVLIGAGALGSTVVCWRRMGSSWRMGIDPHEKTRLIITGPYAFVRHPIYALACTLALATAAAVPAPLMLAVAAAHVALFQWEARREERHMAVHHTEAYAEYRRRVGRFLPRSLRPYRPGALP